MGSMPIFSFFLIAIAVSIFKFIVGGSISSLGYSIAIYISLILCLALVCGSKYMFDVIEVPDYLSITIGAIFVISNLFTGTYYGWPVVFSDADIQLLTIPSMFVTAIILFSVSFGGIIILQMKITGEI
jgi:hypothetical protein